jgi:hypothetical protein
MAGSLVNSKLEEDLEGSGLELIKALLQYFPTMPKDNREEPEPE